jgi:hypothetical protein
MEKDNEFDYNFLMIFRYLLFVVVLQFLTRLMGPGFSVARKAVTGTVKWAET